MDWWYFLSVFPAVLIGRSFCTAVNLIKVAIVPGFHLFPFRTEKLSPTAPMVLRNSGRVGSRRLYRSLPRDERGGDFLYAHARRTGSAGNPLSGPNLGHRVMLPPCLPALPFLLSLLFFWEPLDNLSDTYACVCASNTLRRGWRDLIYVWKYPADNQ